jgi:hypothetical protein
MCYSTYSVPEHGSKEFEEFLVFLGQRVKLQGWDKYAGGLDTKNNSKGVESIYTEFHGLEIMSVSSLISLLPSLSLSLLFVHIPFRCCSECIA